MASDMPGILHGPTFKGLLADPANKVAILQDTKECDLVEVSERERTRQVDDGR